MRKFFLILFMFVSAFIYAETYHFDFVETGDDVDWLVFNNDTGEDLEIRYQFFSTCNSCKVKDGEKIKIRIEVHASKGARVSVPVRFELHAMDGKPRFSEWFMDGKHNDINIYLKKDKGWTF